MRRSLRGGRWRQETSTKVNAEVKKDSGRHLRKTLNQRFTCCGTNNSNSFTMGLCGGLSHCKLALAFAVLMDLLGGAALLIGVFARLEIKGQDFGDLLVYTGALFVLMSLAGWVLWYSGNIEGLTSKKELGHISSAVDRLARNLSRKMRTYRSHH
ncbi:transmembrane protein 238-like protein [Lates japonicus]|uniref:Transmembrane protein 238-like protein n=1 Tax=Lates japonicus TaxID=270547 RepID=A0AAD3MUD0_LATJO|nr:transmembrane protein 238-like protein [Lates japonicus]